MDSLALILSIVGCLNWGLVGIFQFDLVAWLFGGQGSLFSRIVYTVVGLAGLWCISFCFAEMPLQTASKKEMPCKSSSCRATILTLRSRGRPSHLPDGPIHGR